LGSTCSSSTWATAGDETGLYLGLDGERYLRYDNTERAHTGRWTRGRTYVWSARVRLANRSGLARNRMKMSATQTVAW
jgi:hypothetical protein